MDKMNFYTPCDIVHHKGTSSTSVVTSCYSSVKFKKKTCSECNIYILAKPFNQGFHYSFKQEGNYFSLVGKYVWV